MAYMLCMNKLKDYKIWRGIFDSHKQAHIDAGFHLKNIWHSKDNPNEVYFVFALDDLRKAEAFINGPDNARIAREAGVVNGWIKYVEELEIY